MDEELSVEQLIRESERLRIVKELFANNKTYLVEELLAVVLGIEEDTDEES